MSTKKKKEEKELVLCVGPLFMEF